MKKYKIVDRRRFNRFLRMLGFLVAVIFVILFVAFMEQHNGLNIHKASADYHTYEFTQQTSIENNRIKVPVAREVIYRYVCWE